MKKNPENPCITCITCSKDLCESRGCPQWQDWFSRSWNAATKQIQSCVWNEINRRGQQSFRYLLPHELKDPCSNCVCKDWCDTPCSLRLAWWNNRIAQIRAALSADRKRGEQR